MREEFAFKKASEAVSLENPSPALCIFNALNIGCISNVIFFFKIREQVLVLVTNKQAYMLGDTEMCSLITAVLT